MNNKKGFTLVELLATIVILSLVMGIAAVSITGIIRRSREGAYIETAGNIINAIRHQLVSNDRLDSGYYEFTSKILESGGEESPLGGKISYRTSTCQDANKIGSHVCKLTESKTCSADTVSFVYVVKNGGVVTYSICLTAGSGNKYIGLATETEILNSEYSDLIHN